MRIRYLKILVFNLALLLLLLVAVEAFLRWQNPNYHYYYPTHPGQPDLQERLAVPDSTWLRPDEDLGWVCRRQSHLPFPSPPRDDVTYRINRAGFRMPFELTDSIPNHKKKILLLGDSFLFGIYLEAAETSVFKLRATKDSSYVFYNLSVPAWGLDQMYLAYRKYVDLIEPDQVVLAFIDDDLMRTREILYHGCGRKPRLKVEAGQLIPNEDNPAWWEYFCWNNQIGNRFLLAHHQGKAAELGRYLLADIIERETAAGRNPAFIRIPARVDLDGQESRPAFSMQDLMEDTDARYQELYEPFLELGPEEYSRYYIPDDGHFTPAGASRFAAELAELID